VAHYNTILHQLLSLLPRHQFESKVRTLGGDRYHKRLNTWSQLTTLIYAQASGKTSLRDIENGLLAKASRTYHLGLPSKIARSTLADANSRRDWRIYEHLFYTLLERCRGLTPKHKFRFKNPLYSFDSTVIDLCLEMFPWAKSRKRKGALKLHCQLDHAGELPSFVTVTDGKRADISVARESFAIIPDSIYCFDRGYLDVAWLRRINASGAFFVTRSKENMDFHFVGQQMAIEKKNAFFEVEILPTGPSFSQFEGRLRLIGSRDLETGQEFELITNNMTLSAQTIAEIYRARWKIEIFFRWIKQNLKIKTFLGTSKNAVLTQIWVAMSYYLLLAYIKFQTKCRFSLFYLHRLIRETLMDAVSLMDLPNLNEKRLGGLRRLELQLCLQL